MLDNVKEESELYPGKPKSYDRTIVRFKGNKLNVVMNRSTMVQSKVHKILETAGKYSISYG